MIKQYVMALDQGTTSSRAVIFDREGRVAGMSQRELRQIFPQPGWVEHDAVEILETQRAVMEEVLARSGVRAGELAAIGMANQRETVVVWERATGQPVHNAVVWQCRRTAPQCENLRQAGAETEISARTGLVLDAYFSGTKIAWLLDHVAGARRRAEKGELLAGTIDSWLAWNLTDRRAHVTDVTNASRTMLFNLETLDWDDTLLQLLRVPRTMLPRIVSSSEVVGTVAVADDNVPLAGIVGDQQAALFGQACWEPGDAKNTYGTGCFLLMNTGRERVVSRHRLLTTIGWRTADELVYALEGSVFTAGAVIQWLRDKLELLSSSAESGRLAETVDDSGGVCFVPAFSGLGAPYWEPAAQGMITGLSRGTEKSHIVRAALESIAFQSCDLLRAMEADAKPLRTFRVDGGAAGNDLLMQIQADLLGREVQRPANVETTAQGAAWLAGLNTGLWTSRSALPVKSVAARVFVPQRDDSWRKQRFDQWRRAVRTVLDMVKNGPA